MSSTKTSETTSPLGQSLAEHVAACFTGIWIESQEHEEAIREIAELCRDRQWQLAVWDADHGLSTAAGSGEEETASDPLAAIRSLSALKTSGESTTLLVLQNFHRYLGSAEIVQTLANQIHVGKQQRAFIVILAPVVQLPVELEKQFIVIEHHLPDRAQLEQIARDVATEPGELPEAAALDTILDASLGLTRYEAENAFALSLVRHGRLEPETIWQLKAGMLKKSGLMSLHRGGERFNQLGGLDSLKRFCLRIMQNQGRRDENLRPRGVMLLSPPGCGKSQFAKSLGNETNRPTLILDIGSLMGSLVGDTEKNIRRALAIADAIAPCAIMLDEVEKALSGVSSSGDSGVSARLFGTMLTWLNDRTSDVFVVCTCNDISRLPPEFARAERFDGIFFLDLPPEKLRRQIWEIYRRQFHIDAKQPLPIDTDWTGAEIRSCCRLAALLDVSLVEAANHLVPIARTAGEQIESLRRWADGRCLSADEPGIYRFQPAESGKRRKVQPLNN